MSKYKISWLILSTLGLCLAACSSSTSTSTPNPTPSPPTPQDASIQVAAPVDYSAAKNGTQSIPLVIYNHSQYKIESPAIATVGNPSNATINYDMSRCGEIKANGLCSVTANVSGGIAGAFFFNVKSDVVTDTNNKLQSSITSSVNTVVGLSDLSDSSELATVIAPSAIITTEAAMAPVVISVKINSNAVNKYNTVTLVDVNAEKPIPVPTEILSGNSGAGAANFTQNTMVSLKAEIPAQTNDLDYDYKIQLAKCDINGACTNTVTSKNTYHIHLASITTKMGVLGVYPQSVTLNKSQNSQKLILVNRGNIAIKKPTVASLDGNLILSNDSCGDTIASGDNCEYTVKFDSSIKLSKSSSISFKYNDNLTDREQLLPVQYSGASVVHGLTVVDENQSNQFDFSATTIAKQDTHNIKITNTGNSTEFNIAPLAAGGKFTISKTTGSDSCPSSSGFNLATGASCLLALTYNGADIAEKNTSDMTISYGYSSGGSDSITQKLSYQTIETKAILFITPTSADFGTISNDGRDVVSKTFTVKNSGNNTASNLNFSLQDSKYFTQSSSCGSQLKVNDSCQVTVNFGPTAESPTTATGQLTLNYAPNGSSATQSTFSRLSGQIIPANSADFTLSYASSTGFISGDGSINSPYRVVSDAGLPTITYHIMNDGKVAATNVIYTPDATAGWSLTANSCQNAQTIKVGDSCVLTYTMQRISSGANNLQVTGKIMFNDENHQGIITIKVSPNTTYVSVYAAASITITPLFDTSNVVRDNSYQYVVALSSGYPIGDNVVTIDDTSPITGGSCTVNSDTSQCTITVQAILADEEGNQTLKVSNNGEVKLYPSSLAITVAPAKYMFFSTNEVAGNIGGDGIWADEMCNSDAQRPDPSFKYKAMFLSNTRACDKSDWVLQGNQLYKNLYGNLVGKSSADKCMINDGGDLFHYINNGVGLYVWTGHISGQTVVKWDSASMDSNTCKNWTDGGNSSGAIGASWSTKSDWAGSRSAYCYSFHTLYCVQQ